MFRRISAFLYIFLHDDDFQKKIPSHRKKSPHRVRRAGGMVVKAQVMVSKQLAVLLYLQQFR
jgi:hypothetical protein